ncbi:MAG: DUF3109 family protein [Bacteroidales bacterium]|nr:DUF3109 family protein [Bacteroidales bacterium]
MIRIGDILVSTDVVTEYFACDYQKCRGICCVVGDSGAPMLEGEDEQLERCYEVFSPLMTPQGRASVDANGFFEIDREGEMVTPVVHEPHKVEGLDSVPGSYGTVGVQGLEDCAYIMYEKDGDSVNCLCSVERCFFKGLCSFRKPVSCRLYPIRVTRFPGGGQALNYHRWNICSDAVEKGRREGIRVYQFLREPIVEVYGEEFWNALDAASRYLCEG